MEELDKPLKETAQVGYFDLNDIAELIDRLSQHYIIREICAGGYRLEFGEFPALRQKLQRERLNGVKFTLAHKEDSREAGTLELLPRSTRFEVDRSTPREVGLWDELREFFRRHSQDKRFQLVLPPALMFAFGLMFAGYTLATHDYKYAGAYRP